MRPWHLFLLPCIAVGLFLGPMPADDTKTVPVFDFTKAPKNIDDLKAIQAQVTKVVGKVTPCTVGVRMGAAQGSGVIISKDGYVLTAGHVSGKNGRDCTIVFPDGKTAKAKTMGANKTIDSGLIKLEGDGPWPFVEMGKSEDLKKGQWCIALGQPGGFRPGRTPPVRVGRILEASRTYIRTDCTLVGGDSGGPLFDMDGKVIGIHSRIGGAITANIHVPVDTYRDTWDRLVKSEVWGGDIGGAAVGGPYLGVQGDPSAEQCKITQVSPDSPAEKGGLKVNDVVTKFDGQKVVTFEDLVEFVRKKKPGDEVVLEVARGDEMVKLKLVVGKRPS
jgi:serine protease Do